MNHLPTLKKKDVARLTRRLEDLNLIDPNEITHAKMEQVKLALNLEMNKEEVEWEQ